MEPHDLVLRPSVELSHALIGGTVGAAIMADGFDAVYGSGLVDKVLIPSLLAPLFGILSVQRS